MAEATWKTYTLVMLAASLVASLFGNVMPDPTHHCDSKQSKAYCFATTSTRCYQNPEKTSWKVCNEGWKPNTIDEEAKECSQTVVAYDADGSKYLCKGIGKDQECQRMDDLVMGFG